MRTKHSWKYACVLLAVLMLWGCGDILVDGDDGTDSGTGIDTNAATDSITDNVADTETGTGTNIDTDTVTDTATNDPDCYSPYQNVSIAYDAGAVGCACDPVTDEGICVQEIGTAQRVGLICEGSQWQAVEDGPCMIKVPQGTDCVTEADCRVESNCCECLSLPIDEPHGVCDMHCTTNKCESDGIPVDEALCVNGHCVLDVRCQGSGSLCMVDQPDCDDGQMPAVDDEGICFTGVCVTETECRNWFDELFSRQ